MSFSLPILIWSQLLGVEWARAPSAPGMRGRVEKPPFTVLGNGTEIMNQTKRASFVLAAGVVLLVFGLAGFAIPARDTAAPVRVFYENAGGGVLFPHNQHESFDCQLCHHEMLVEEVATHCTQCHHENSFALAEWEDEFMGDLHLEFTDEESSACIDCHTHADFMAATLPPAQSSCAQCHDDYADYESIMTGHNCSACHARSDEKTTLLSCSVCHQSGEGNAQGCAACHADDGYEADMFEHADLTGMQGHSCQGCHVASRGADAIHNRCNRCHFEIESLTFFTRSKDDSETVCKTCHMQ